MPLYDPAAHPLLSSAAAALDTEGDPNALDEQAEVAINLLGLRDTAYTDADAAAAVRAVAIQVNLQVELGVEGFAYSSLTRGARSFDSKDKLIDPRAAAIVATLSIAHAGGSKGDVWPTIGSFRPTA